MRKRYRVKVTPPGYIYVLLTIALSIGVANTGNNLLYLMASLMLALMALSGLGSLGNLFFLKVSISPAHEVFAGIPAQFHLIIHKTRGHSFFLSCETAFGSIQIPFVKGRLEAPLWLIFPERGATRIMTVEIHSGFPFGFFRRFRRFPLDLDVLVFPKPLPCPIPSLSGDANGKEETFSIQGELSDEIKELRKPRVSDPIKWVDWKATARRGEVIVRDFYRYEGDTLLIDLTRREKDWEKRLSEACFLVLEGHKKRLSVSLLLPDQEIAPNRGKRHKRLILEALTLA